MFVWNADMIHFFRDASEYNGFNDLLAMRISMNLQQNVHVCDAGCGLGYLSLTLARYCRQVTSIDCSPKALAVLRENIKKGCVQNINIVEGDIWAMTPPKKYNAMIFCFFGNVDETLSLVRTQCNGKAFLIKKKRSTYHFTSQEKPFERFTYERTIEDLKAYRIPFTTETFSFEMGQPFRSLDDAAVFFQTYDHKGSGTPISLKNIKSRLVVTGKDKFSYFLPVMRELGMIVLNAGNIPDSIAK